ncbi:MAG: diacylglycerol/lipid kinase family protein [Rubrivivax sp.]
MTETLCLLNPHAQGGRLRRRAPALRQAVTERAPAAVLAQPESVEEALGLIRALPGGSRVLAFGGDGTVNRWLPALLEGGHTLGLVPLGSGNDLARALGVFGLPWAQAMECALTSAASLMDVGVVELPESPRTSGAVVPHPEAVRHELGAVSPQGPGGTRTRPRPPKGAQETLGAALRFLVDPVDTASASRHVPFLSSLAVGFDASVGLRALRGPRWLRGQPRYLLATLQELLHLRSWELRVECDGGAPDGEGGRVRSRSPGQGDAASTWHGRVLLASTLNTRSYGSGMPAAPDARIDDGRLELLRAQAMGRAGVLTLLPRLLRGTHLSDPRVSLQSFQTLQVQAQDPVPLAVDGEYLGAFNRFAVRVLPGRLPVVRSTKSPRFGK